MSRTTSRCILAVALLLAPAPLWAQQAAPAAAPAQAPAEAAPAAPVDEAFDAEAQRLASAIEAILGRSDVTAGTVGIHIADVGSGKTLYSRGADEPMNPASNMKLITGAAALDAFGPQHTFTTEILADRVDGATVDGSLYVRGQGEAFLLFEDVLDWAGELRLEGVEKITGDIVVDDTAFDGAYLPPGFEQKPEDASYRSPIGAVSINFNAVTAVIEPGPVGEACKVRLVPPNDHVKITNQATTSGGRRSRIRVESRPTDDGGTELIIGGHMGQHAGPVYSRKRIDNPPAFAGAVLARALGLVGIAFDGEIRTGKTPASAQTLVSHQSQPLSYVVLAMNKWSNNFMAEQLLRVLGTTQSTQPSTWEASRAAVMDFLQKAGVDTASVTVHNGSGLYDGNLVSPRQFVTLLRYMADHKNAPEYLSSLAIAGVDGTLAKRMGGPATAGNMRGKTGTLNNVSALSGYLRTDSGRFVAFSILFNDPPRRAWHYRPVQDAIVEAIAGFGE